MQTALFEPFATDIKIPIEKSTLTPLQREFIYQAAANWPDDKKQAKNSWFYPPLSSMSMPFRLDYSIIKIDGQVYLLHHHLLGKGGFGRVKFLENVRTGEIAVVKISESVAAIQEIKVLLDLGLLRGTAVRVSMPASGGLVGRRKIYIVMPYLGKSLRQHLKENEHNLDSLKDQTRTFLGAMLAKTYGDLHRGLPFISGLGYAQRDAKPNNIILNTNGYVIIDHGSTVVDPKAQRLIRGGTPPYVPKIVRNVEPDLDYSPMTRSGEFVDMVAVQGILNPRLLNSHLFVPRLQEKYLGLFNAEYLRKHNLGRCLAPAFKIGEGYIDEAQFPAKDGWALAAYIIASETISTQQEMLQRIFSDENLALCILAEFFADPEEWFANSPRKLQNIYAYTRNELQERALIVKYDLITEFSQALRSALLMRILKSRAQHDDKRAAVCLFKRDLLTSSNYDFITSHENLAELCIEAHKYDDVASLRDILFGRHDHTIGFLQQKSSRYFVRTRPNNSAVFENADELRRAKSLLRGFDVSYVANAVLQEQYASGALANLLDMLANSDRNFNSSTVKYVEELVDASVVYTFITNDDYRTAILDIMQQESPIDMKKQLLELLFTDCGLWVARLYLEVEKSFSTSEIFEKFSQGSTITMAAKILQSEKNKLNTQDMVGLLMGATDAFNVLKRISRLLFKLTSDDIKQLLFISSTYPRIYKETLLVMHNREVLYYILHEPNKPAYFFAPNHEEAKVAAIEQVFNSTNCEQALLVKRLASSSLLPAAVALFGTRWFTTTEIRQLVVTPGLAERVQELPKLRITNIVFMRNLFHRAIVSSNTKLELTAIEQMSLNFVYMLKSLSMCTRPHKAIVNCAKYIQKMHSVLESLDAVYLDDNSLISRESFANIQCYIKNNMYGHGINSVIDGFLSKFEELLTMLDGYAQDSQVIRDLRPVRVKAERTGRDALYYLNIRTKNAAVYLRDLTEISQYLRKELYVVRHNNPTQIHVVR